MAPSITFPPAATIEILDGSNWLSWSACILALLRMNGLWLCYVRTFFIVSHHHSKRAVLCVVVPYTIQRFLCVTNGHGCVTFTNTIALMAISDLSGISGHNTMVLCWHRVLRSSHSTSLSFTQRTCVGYDGSLGDSTTRVLLVMTPSCCLCEYYCSQ
jgi:hypothetical protein